VLFNKEADKTILHSPLELFLFYRYSLSDHLRYSTLYVLLCTYTWQC